MRNSFVGESSLRVAKNSLSATVLAFCSSTEGGSGERKWEEKTEGWKGEKKEERETAGERREGGVRRSERWRVKLKPEL